MKEFVTVKSAEYEYEISRSRFIGICRRVVSAEDAAAVLADIRKKYSDATHVCYAFVSGEISRSSDDGEPSGTAGTPIAECIKKANLNQTLVAVVRYFGGIKLGAGGLVRAYSHTAATALGDAQKINVAYCDIYRVAFDYAVYKKIEKRSFDSLYKILGQEYNSRVELTYAAQDGAGFIEEITAAACGKLTVTPQGSDYVERPLQ